MGRHLSGKWFSEKALHLYSAALNIDPDNYPAKIGKAEALSILFYYSCALKIYEELLEQFPDNIKLKIAIARLYAWSKKYKTSLSLYDQIIAMNPRNPVPYFERARTALWGKYFQLGMETYNALLECPPESLSDLLIQKSARLEKRAKKLNWNNRYICAVTAYQNLIAFNPGNEEALFDYAQVYCSMGLCDYSRPIYKQILNIDPNHNLVKRLYTEIN
ncbi:MAG: hypothetical protein HWD61_11570 [Parachlamydiaceae bacterium]|nr:MAG: hypothetical protein HWD61_11570 [Parachlamydiaceae bacterium]